MTNIDTPDHQSSQVSAQKLLATVAAGTANVTVDLPTNIETLVIATVGKNQYNPLVKGQTSLQQYPGVLFQTESNGTDQWLYFADVSPTLDSKVGITVYGDAATAEWYVYSDNAARVVSEAGFASASAAGGGTAPYRTLQVGGIDKTVLRPIDVDDVGRQRVVPEIPSTVAGEGPSYEATITSTQLTAAGTVIAAPGAGFRLRIFGVQMSTMDGTLTGVANDSSTNGVICACGIGNYAVAQIPAQGFPLSTNAALDFTAHGGTGHMRITATYTTETV